MDTYQYQDGPGGLGIFLAIYAVLFLALFFVGAAGLWKMFAKAGKPGWAAIVPVYQWWVWVEIIGRPRWWFWAVAAFAGGVLLSFILPILGIIVLVAGIAVVMLYLIGCIDMAKCFGRSPGYGFGLWLLPIIFMPILGFGSARYEGGDASQRDAVWATAMGNTDAPPTPASSTASPASSAEPAPEEMPSAPVRADAASPPPYTLAAPRAPVAPLGSWPPAASTPSK